MLDIILIAILFVMAVLGFRKGFLKSLIGMFGNLIALALSYVLAEPVTVRLNESMGIAEKMAGTIRDLLPMPDNFSMVLASFEGMGQLYTYLDQSILPDGIKQSILSAVQEQVNAVGAGIYATMADTIAITVAISILQGLVFIGLWALFCVVLFLASHVLSGVVHLVPVVGLIDRLGGMAVSLVLTVITILILYKGISVLGLMEGSLFAESQILHFCSELLNPEVTESTMTGGITGA
ncbi:MAG: CvpA family protein [Peptococcaceae bacterium]|nr:CvpA family protein [Peptococcaceae bacterium]